LRALIIPGLRSWRVSSFPLNGFYFERDNYPDVMRLLGARQAILFIFKYDIRSAWASLPA